MPNTTNHIPALLYTRRLRELADKMMVRDGRHICGVRDNLDHHSFIVGWVEGQRDAAGEFKKTITEGEECLNAATQDLLEAAKALEHAESAHTNCAECGGSYMPELCETCFPLFDDARIKRRKAIAKATAT